MATPGHRRCPRRPKPRAPYGGLHAQELREGASLLALLLVRSRTTFLLSEVLADSRDGVERRARCTLERPEQHCCWPANWYRDVCPTEEVIHRDRQGVRQLY